MNLVALFTIPQLILLFISYSFLGWLMEVTFSFILTRKFVNRGFLWSPICPMYGFGVLLVLVLLGAFKNNIPLLYIGSVIVTSLLELTTGWLLELLFHQRWWDYSTRPLNLNGYICLPFSLLWGIGALIVIQVIHPIVSAWVSLIPQQMTNVLAIGMTLGLSLDVALTLSRLITLNKLLSEIERYLTLLNEGFENKIDLLQSKSESVVIDLRKRLVHQGKQYRRLLIAFPDAVNTRSSSALSELKKIINERTGNKMKKILATLTLLVVLTGCNLQIIDTTWKYDKAYINVGDQTIVCDVSSWKDYKNSDMIQVKCKDGRTFLGHSSAIILQSGE